ncbi:hypothetical protein PHAVU_008G134000 [Phaseolus vulgaris]|uniref:DUF506 family protein n=1 Tax=Phaseolus vulgaris TaxID=3885 RepID=V7B4G7_PHAVU|nr:hypothetical protein PHAVU_008G134000g [Phaseolus vulgaris]ESW12689.1 hypothetical protein PHAVU_008G134000g [Phaseolus vulgaris]
MPSFPRKKRVTDPFDDQARARLVGADHCNFNSGTQSSGDSDSLSLSYLVHGFLEEDADKCREDSVFDDSDCDRVDSTEDSGDSMSDSASVAISLSYNADPFRKLLIAHVSEAAEKFSFLRERNPKLFRRNVAAFLRDKRHNAAVCETAPDASGGSHEFIDVVQSGATMWRYFVDLDFRAQFEIARPTRRFSDVLAVVPGVFVGCAEELKRTVSTLCDALRRSFKNKGLPVPPWRKNGFMQNKWFGPCRRTADPVRMSVNGVSCRLVGFDDTVMEAGRVLGQDEQNRTVY